MAQLTGASCPAETDEAYTYQSVGSDIIIYGGSVRGTFYGVCSFLENELGMRWYTWDYTKIPRIESWQFDNLYHSEQPTIAYRYSNYWRVNFSFEWSARNKENMKWGSEKSEDAKLHSFTVNGNDTGRYLKVKVYNYGKMPNWHISAGEQAWLFMDEITVE